MGKSFCLVDEKWIPIVGRGKVSLIDVFTDKTIVDIDGNPVQKISLIKFFIAIAYAACDLKTEHDWECLGVDGLSERVTIYLKKHRDDFYLFGDKPFLQISDIALKDGAKQSKLYYDFVPDLASENDTILRELQKGKTFTDSDKALFIITLMNYALGGKRVMKIEPLTPGFKKSSSAKAGPSIGGFYGYLQTMIIGRSLIETIWLNMITDEDLDKFPYIKFRKILPPWEKMPTGEDDDRAKEIKFSIFAWLISLSRFVLLDNDSIYYAEGIQYPSVADGYEEPFIVFNREKRKCVYADPSKKPWRELPALLMAAFRNNPEWTCPIIYLYFERARRNVPEFGIWSGGLRVSANSGDQNVKRSDDYVESSILISSEAAGQPFYDFLCDMISRLSDIEKRLRIAVSGYYKDLGYDNSPSYEFAARAANEFWQLVDGYKDELLNCSEEQSIEGRHLFFKKIWSCLIRVYEQWCPADSPRQIAVFVKNQMRRDNDNS